MKKLILLGCLLISSAELLAQQFLQYNTETVYDSFENPSQRSFIRDTTRKFAFNFFFPSITTNGYLTGNVQQTLVNRLSNAQYDNSNLQIGEGKRNYLNLNINAYLFMFKVYLDQKGDQELGLSMKLVGEGRANVTDETIALFNGGRDFGMNDYSGVFNSSGAAQVYQQYGLSFREKVTPRLALGIKANFLLGVEQHKLNVTRSDLAIDRAANTATFSAKGSYYKTGRTIMGLKNPGLSVTLGGTYLYENGMILQGNIKDLGFIYWGDEPSRVSIDGTVVINNFTSGQSEKNVDDKLSGLINRSPSNSKGFFTGTNGLAEASLSKRFWLDDRHRFRAFPTLLLQKQLFYDGITGVLMSHFQYNKFNLSVSSSYDNRNLFAAGMQFMYKAPNFEVFAGTERIIQTRRLASSLMSDKIYNNTAYTGADIFLGMSFKFGYPIESPANSSFVPMGSEGPGFLGRIYNKIFKGSAKKVGEMERY
ncbi:hypothetical protein DJ568_08255 [Mucilaginibacter hurinus]|uniref:DUF5723 domain-containing protein n=1 Tax=Mucilaginibacter hurinus TaxID=2201324 RepID=A0A367GR55_9SPHI|nr:DUF5723 family protein [Mucilaginibacter hurinus]RCH55171.1 hypothetical protein DJ568_08255 [Mucilaginibacter hurinus]